MMNLNNDVFGFPSPQAGNGLKGQRLEALMGLA